MANVVVTKVTNLNVDDVYPLVLQAKNEGFHFVRRFYDDYISGTNRFERDGEALFVARQLNQVVGVCGLNQDPYTAGASVGRVRRLYVHPAFRQHGVGRQLVSRVICAARRHYETLTLRTDNPEADRFYRAIGFSTNHLPDSATHWLLLNPNSDH